MELGCDSMTSYREGIPPVSLNLHGGAKGDLHDPYGQGAKTYPDDMLLSSPDTSGSSTPIHDSIEDNGFCSTEEIEDHELEIDTFIKDYVHWLFDTEYEISYENKAKFGELMKDAAARLSLAKYIDAQRCQSKCVCETTFYKLIHCFALVLFECGEADDYLPGKSLMNMAFTYYYIPDSRLVTCDAFGSGESLSSSASNNETDKTTRRSNSDGDKYFPKKKSFMERFKKEVEACKQIFADTPSFQELKQGVWRHKSAQDNNKVPVPPISRSVSDSSAMTYYPEVYSPATKIFLYEHLKNQVIWKSLRFWNAAFFSAVHHERKRRCIQKEWTELSHDEREMTNESIVNITFGQLGTFINNMKCLGLDKKTCMEFLRKQSIIGGIEEGGQYYGMLVEQIEDDCTF